MVVLAVGVVTSCRDSECWYGCVAEVYVKETTKAVWSSQCLDGGRIESENGQPRRSRPRQLNADGVDGELRVCG